MAIPPKPWRVEKANFGAGEKAGWETKTMGATRRLDGSVGAADMFGGVTGLEPPKSDTQLGKDACLPHQWLGGDGGEVNARGRWTGEASSSKRERG